MHRPDERSKQDLEHKEDASEHLWAVSYSDLLMVLMSFFIIYFNFNAADSKDTINKLLIELSSNPEIKEIDPVTGKEIEIKEKNAPPKQFLSGFGGSLSDKIASSFSGEGRKPGSVGEGHGNVGGKGGSNANMRYLTFPTKNLREVKDIQAEVTQGANIYNQEGLLVDFSDDLFPIGKYQLSKKAMKEIDLILKTIEPVQKNVAITFIGHTDQIPIKSQRKIIDSNLILAGLRASKAAEYAISKGFNPLWVSTQGVSEKIRNTRSLSVRIIER